MPRYDPVGTDGILRRQGANLPHWTRELATYSVTFRLADSLPAEVLNRWRSERMNIVGRARLAGRPLGEVEQRRLTKLYSEKVEQYLDSGAGECHLRQPRIARLIQSALLHFDQIRYDMIAWCIMPNHVHTVFTPRAGFGLPGILHSWKGFTSTEANRMLGRTGSFWQAESYDHLIRDVDDLHHAVRYVLDNPARAGMKNWPWAGLHAAALESAIRRD